MTVAHNIEVKPQYCAGISESKKLLHRSGGSGTIGAEELRGSSMIVSRVDPMLEPGIEAALWNGIFLLLLVALVELYQGEWWDAWPFMFFFGRGGVRVF